MIKTKLFQNHQFYILAKEYPMQLKKMVEEEEGQEARVKAGSVVNNLSI